MSRFSRCALAAAVLALLLIARAGSPLPTMAQAGTPCDQLPVRLDEIRDQQAHLQSEYTEAITSSDMEKVGPIADQLGDMLSETDALLRRIDDCSRSPVPSLAD